MPFRAKQPRKKPPEESRFSFPEHGTRFFTSRPSACGESFMLCRNKTLSNGLVKTRERANRHPHKPANLSAKKWNTSAKGNMALARRNRPLPLACRRRGVPVWNCPHRGAPGNERKDRPDAISPGAGRHEAAIAHAFARDHTRAAPRRRRGRNPQEFVPPRQESRAPTRTRCALSRRQKSRPDEKEKTLVAPSGRRSGFPRTLPARWCADNSAGHRTSAPSNFHLQNGPVRLYSTLRSEFLNYAVGPWVSVAWTETTLARGNPAPKG